MKIEEAINTQTRYDSPITEQDAIEISVIIPVYNQERSVVSITKSLEGLLSALGTGFEIIIVNDGSTDNTLSVLKEIANGHVRVLGYEKNMGKGYAVKKGVVNSIGKFIIFLDGDLDIPPELISEYMRQVKSYDLIIASKRHPNSRVNSPMSRRFLSRGFAFIVQRLLGLDVKDTQTGLKAGEGGVFRIIFESIATKRYAFDVELLTLAKKLDLSIKELPIQLTIDRRFKVREIAVMFKDLLSIYWRYRMNPIGPDWIKLKSSVTEWKNLAQAQISDKIKEIVAVECSGLNEKQEAIAFENQLKTVEAGPPRVKENVNQQEK